MFGNNLSAHRDFLDGPETGPGGLKELTADEQGMGIAARVGMKTPIVESSLIVEFDELVFADGSCAVRLDDTRYLGVVTNARDAILVYLIGNPVVRTPEELGIGSTLEELQQSYDVDVATMEDGSMLATTAPVAAADPITGTEPTRSMLFELDSQGVVIGWRVGATALVERSRLCA